MAGGGVQATTMGERKVYVQPEQIYCVAVVDGKFQLGDRIYDKIPWKLLAKSYLYALEEADLEVLLGDACSRGYMILDGAVSDRRGLRGFSVAIGAWGWRGCVECRTVESWAIIRDDRLSIGDEVCRIQAAIRELCVLLNSEPTTFRPTALTWLSGLYTRLGRPHEPDDVFPPPLPSDVALMCRRAHIGGPVIHSRTTLEPFVSLDRDRAYGEAMLDFLPSGAVTDLDLGVRPMLRWAPAGLMRAMGIAEATIRVEMGPFIPLLPITRYDHVPGKTRTLHPTGTLRGFWTLSELAYLEESGKGRVEQLHRVVVFEKARPFASMIRYLRSLERALPMVKMKRLEHMQYGRCARALSLSRFSSTRGDVRPMPGDILDSRTLERLTSRVEVSRFHRKNVASPPRHLPLHLVSGKLSEETPPGTMDRPDRSAWITSANRIAMHRIIDQLDTALGSSRSGEYVGRIYVDGIDIEAPRSKVPAMEGVSVRRSGSRMDIYRSNAYVAHMDDGSLFIESGGHTTSSTVEDLVKTLEGSAEDREDGGPLAGGRHWPLVDGCDDPRLLEDQRSEPLHLDESLVGFLGFSS